ncbi:hypothetical protein SAMN05444169_4084 [Bradyrhizobium erythrophlei]|uniref:Lipoprotein n=1 Tax=Bradyrhizobium erythrophlei TaxID=1437360 RepID=A0A1M5MK27_9BRAD|nr:hypothetical protein SAMN05444169_4084 [Bradyrhizobium erythrophlei]
MRIAIAAAVVAGSLAGCHSDGEATSVLDQAPIESALLIGDYKKIAGCAYERLEKTAGNGIKKADLEGSSRLALESGGVRYWELLFRPAGKNETKVDLSVVQTMWGPDTMSTAKIMPEVRACAT